jgi:hypothetical protein
MKSINSKKKASFFIVAFAVIMIAGLLIISPAAIQQEAQAKKGEANEHISDQGRSHQSATGAANSGVQNEVEEDGVFCFEMTGGLGCFDSREQCDAARELINSSEEVCTRYPTPPGDYLICSIQSVDGEPDVVCTQVFD